jgi:hypothetical protein
VSTPADPRRATLSAEEAAGLVTALQSELIGTKAKVASLEETIAKRCGRGAEVAGAAAGRARQAERAARPVRE